MKPKKITSDQFLARFTRDFSRAVDLLVILDICEKQKYATRFTPFTVEEIFACEDDFLFLYKDGGGDNYAAVKAGRGDFSEFCAVKLAELKKKSPGGTLTIELYGETETDLGEKAAAEHSYYCVPQAREAPGRRFIIRGLTAADRALSRAFENEDGDMLGRFFSAVENNEHYYEAALLGAFTRAGEFAAYLLHSGLTAAARDVNYVRTGERHRRQGAALALLNEYKNYCAENKKTAFYSSADGAESESLAEKSGFIRCSERKIIIL